MKKTRKLVSPATVPPIPTQRPASVVRLTGERWARNLMLRWQPPRNRAPVSGYRIQRTPNGRTYETIGKTRNCEFQVITEPGEMWFYRVTAWNRRGSTRSDSICFFRAADLKGLKGPRMKSLLQHFPVMPGVTITVCELVPE